MRRKMMTFSAALVLLVSAGIFTAKEMAPANELAQRNAKALAQKRVVWGYWMTKTTCPGGGTYYYRCYPGEFTACNVTEQTLCTM